jgi:Tfp pilus assembly protein PilF
MSKRIFSIKNILGLVALSITLLSGTASSNSNLASAVPRTPASVILISVDTLRADHLSCYGYRRASTPHIDAISQRGTLFTQVNSQVPLTLPSHVSLLTSTYPFANGIEDNAAELGPDAVSLTTVLKSHGYRTGAFVGGFVLDRRFGLNGGFDEYDSPFDLHRQGGKDPSEIKRLGENVTSSAENWLAGNSGSPFFLFLHLYDLHTPYELPQGKKPPRGTSGYDVELGYVDGVLGQFWDFLQQRQLLTHTLVVFVSDHGESLGDHGESTHGYFIYESTLHVPLIFHWPTDSGPFPSQVDRPAALMDVAPTVLQYLSLPEPAHFQGRSLLSTLRGQASAADEEIYSESLYAHNHFATSSLRSVRVGAYKYIQAPKPELYDLAHDPRESANLYETKHALALSLQERLAGLRSRYQPKNGTAPANLTPEVVERLRSLGYLSVGSSHPASLDAGPDPKDRIRAFEEYGRALLQAFAGDLTGADSELKRLLNEDPNLIDVRVSLGLDEQKLNQHEQAAREFQQALRQDPLNTLAHFNLAVSQVALNRPDDAVKELQAVLAMAPYYTRAEELLGTIWLQKHDYARAHTQFSHLLTIDPNDYAAHYNLGVLAVVEKQWTEGEQQLRAALNIDPSSPESHNTLGSLYLQLGELDKAQQEFERAVSLQPKFAWAHYNLGIVLHQEKQDDAALREFQRATDADPQFSAAREAARKLEESKP